MPFGGIGIFLFALGLNSFILGLSTMLTDPEVNWDWTAHDTARILLLVAALYFAPEAIAATILLAALISVFLFIFHVICPSLSFCINKLKDIFK